MTEELRLKKIHDPTDKFSTPKKKSFDLALRLLIVGKTGSGKTSGLVSLLTQKNFYLNDFKGHNIYVFSPMINDYKMEKLIKVKKIPDINVYTEFSDDSLNSIYDDLTDEFAEEQALGDKVSNKLVILDDLSFDGSLRRGNFNSVARIFMNGRKHNISCIVTSQYYAHNLPSVRANASGLILYNMNDKQLELINDDHNFLENKKSFKALFRENLTETHDHIIINYSNSRKDGLYLDKNFNKLA